MHITLHMYTFTTNNNKQHYGKKNNFQHAILAPNTHSYFNLLCLLAYFLSNPYRVLCSSRVTIECLLQVGIADRERSDEASPWRAPGLDQEPSERSVSADDNDCKKSPVDNFQTIGKIKL